MTAPDLRPAPRRSVADRLKNARVARKRVNGTRFLGGIGQRLGVRAGAGNEA